MYTIVHCLYTQHNNAENYLRYELHDVAGGCFAIVRQ